MLPIFSQPLGFIALAGIPLLIVIYCLRQKLKKREISTLFLLPTIQRETPSGTKLTRWENAASFWWQVLAVILIAWVLVEPRFILGESSARVIVVLDESASMHAFKRKAPEVFKQDVLPALKKSANHIEWILCTDRGAVEPLYRGNSSADFFAAWENFEPFSGSHDSLVAVEKLRKFFPGKNTAVVFVSDKIPANIPADTLCLAVGEPIRNVGFSGLSISKDANGNIIWRAGIQNYSDVPAEISWELEGIIKAQKVSIPAHGNTIVQNAFPPQATDKSTASNATADQFTLRIRPEDDFQIDNTLMFVRPQPRVLRFSTTTGTPAGIAKLIGSFEETTRAADPHLQVRTATSVPASSLPKNVFGEIVFLKRPENQQEKPIFRIGEYTSTSHILTDDLSWRGFVAAIIQKKLQLPHSSEILLWQNETPAVVLETFPDGKTRLIFNLESSDWARNDAAILMLHRYCESVRERIIEKFHANFECGEKLPTSKTKSAPEMPGFFEIKNESGDLVLIGASHFADVREADFSQAKSGIAGDAALKALAERNTLPDPLRPLWLLLALAAALLGWRTRSRK